MTRRFDFGALVCGLGALLLMVALFLDWFGDANAWKSFELADVALAGLAIAVLVGVAARLELIAAGGERLPLLGAAALAIVAVQVIDPPAAAGDADAATGAWLGLAASALILAGAPLSLLRVSLHVVPRERPDHEFEAVDQRRQAVPEAPAPEPMPIPTPPYAPGATPAGSWAAVPEPAGWEPAPGWDPTAAAPTGWAPEHVSQPPTMPLEVQPRQKPAESPNGGENGDAEAAEARAGTDAPDGDGG